ncbi:hypothetical protein EQG63_06075 [Flavobacterium amnicola]|uniref:Copper-binding protein MbnP-like domain-containing protein n=1 Tax=Flavobacterium amnicola TaxID=2506422 RepID=A0A4Q1K2Q6_9FLAO|nr:MbnP family protein [Flavobacterium amnicola]RXR19009.1 hypothetical protein EQG63_06075 [Flavobacterium amnicola]
MLSKLFLPFILLLSFWQAVAQNQSDSLALTLKIEWKGNPLALSKTYISSNNDTLQLHQLKFYVGNIQIDFNDKSNFQQKVYHLIDLENLNSMRIPICKNEKKNISQISFSIGVDSLQSVSGALAGDLDPAKGMYWAWQSGYINMKIEGTSSSCATRNNAFHFHIGGYLPPNNASRKIVLTPKSNSLEVIVDVATLFDNILLSENNSIMIPGKKAMEIANKCTKIFASK